jgi:hypothetical protein
VLNKSSGVVMLIDTVKELMSCFEKLQASLDHLQECINADQLPFVLPADERNDRSTAIKSFSQIFYSEKEKPAIAGLLCASKATIFAATEVNIIKAEFKDIIKTIRKNGQSSKTRIDKLINSAMHKQEGRHEDVSLALKRSNIADANLMRCYANIRVLPANVESLSWSWTSKHSAIQKMSVDEARKVAKEIQVQKTREIVTDMLDKLDQGTFLAHKKPLPNALRANIVYHDNNERKRKVINVSGVVLCPGPTLPRYIWRDDPVENKRVPRCDSTIEPYPYIKSLRLHLYTSDVSDVIHA